MLGAARILAVLVLGAISGCTSTLPGNLGSVSGLVVDDHGILLPGATVELARGLGRPAQVSTSFSDGEYIFHKVTADTYRLTASLPGFDLVEPVSVVLAPGADARADVLRLRSRMLSGPVASDNRRLIEAQAAVLGAIVQTHRMTARNYLVAVFDGHDWKSPPPLLVAAVTAVTRGSARSIPAEKAEAYREMASQRREVLLIVADRPDAAASSLVLLRGAVEVGRSMWWYRVHLKREADGWVAAHMVKLVVAG